MQPQQTVHPDNLAKDLQAAVTIGLQDLPPEVFSQVYVPLMTELVTMVALRDHRVFDHAYKLGKEQSNAKDTTNN